MAHANEPPPCFGQQPRDFPGWGAGIRSLVNNLAIFQIPSPVCGLLRISRRIASASPPALCRGKAGLGTSRRSRQTPFPRHKAGGDGSRIPEAILRSVPMGKQTSRASRRDPGPALVLGSSSQPLGASCPRWRPRSNQEIGHPAGADVDNPTPAAILGGQN